MELCLNFSLLILLLFSLHSHGKNTNPTATTETGSSLSPHSERVDPYVPLQQRTNEASSSAHLPLNCIRLIDRKALIPDEFAVKALAAIYSYLYAGASGSVGVEPRNVLLH